MSWELLVTAWCGHTDASRELANDLDAALDAHGIKRMTAAEMMGLSSEKALIRQIAGTEPMHIGRVAMLFAKLPDVKRTFLALTAARDGGTYLTPHQTLVIKGAAALGPRRMAKMLPPQPERKERSA